MGTSSLQSSVGHKLIMALSGFVLVGFLLAHLSGNLLIYGGPELINRYAEGLRQLGAILWVLRAVTLLAVILHIRSALILTKRNREARPQDYAFKKSIKASYASKTMMMSGLVILSFIFYHLAHLTFRWTHAQEFAHLGPFDVYVMMILSFKSPLVTSFYCLSVVLLMIHLYHGMVSIFQTLGLNHSPLNPVIKTVGPLLSIGLAIGFISIPISVFLGLLG